MDIAKAFKPRIILLWQQVASHPEAIRIVNMFPSAEVTLVKHQRIRPLANHSMGQALRRGKRVLMIGGTSSFVGYFDGRLGWNVHCGPYYKLVPISNGCPYYCTYCYLAFVYRKFRPFIKLNINYDTMFGQLRKVVAHRRGKVSFNMGEMLDSLALDHITNLTSMLVPFFSGVSNGYLMLLTKSSNIDNLLAVEPNQQTVVSWSLNSQRMIETHELGTASLDERIEAAKRCQEHGYRIRFRIDPGILCPNWKAEYADVVQRMLAVTQPENITLGMLRLLPGHFGLAVQAYGERAQSLCSHRFVAGAADGKLRYPPQQRIEFYMFLIDIIRSFDKHVSISLCRETREVWDVLGDHCERHKCNCLIW